MAIEATGDCSYSTHRTARELWQLINNFPSLSRVMTGQTINSEDHLTQILITFLDSQEKYFHACQADNLPIKWPKVIDGDAHYFIPAIAEYCYNAFR